MTRDEVKQLLMRIDVSYPNWKPKDLSLLVEVWFETLGEYEYKDVLIALKTFITTDTSGFAPSIGQLINSMRNIQALASGEDIGEMQAWSLVSKALRNGIYNSVREYNNLPQIVQKAVGSPENLHNWATSDYETIETVVQSNFLRSFRTTKERGRELLTMPTDVRQLIESSVANMNYITSKDYD